MSESVPVRAPEPTEWVPGDPVHSDNAQQHRCSRCGAEWVDGPASCPQSEVGGTFGARLKTRRVAAGLTQTEFAEAVDLTRSSIANIEAGRQASTIADVQRYADALAVDPAWLAFGHVTADRLPAWQHRREEWCVFYGGPDPDNAAGTEVRDDEADAREHLQWIDGSHGRGVAMRSIYYGPWTVVEGGEPHV